jgi:hypothetical protein
MNKATLFLATFSVTLFAALASQATPIAKESFATSAGGDDYVPFTTIRNQNPTVGSMGFDGPWGISSTASMVPVFGGLTHPLTPGDTFEGQLVSFTSDGSVGGFSARNLSRSIDYTPVDGTYYMSVLLGKNAPSTRVDLLAGLGRAQNAETGVFSVEGAWIGFLDGGITFGHGPGANLTTLLNAGEVPVDETFFALLQIDYTESGSDTVTATVYDGSSSVVASQAFPGLDLDASMGRFSVLTQDFGPAGAVDEWRFGTELADVMVQPVTGDFDDDGDVDGADFLKWQRGELPNPLSASDLALWENQFGTTSTLSATASIPEPSTLLLAALAALRLLMRKGDTLWMQ